MNRFAQLITQALTEKHGLILTELLELGDKTIAELAPHCMITKPAVTILVERLEELGYVRRINSKDDGRLKLVSLKPKGRSFAKSLNR